MSSDEVAGREEFQGNGKESFLKGQSITRKQKCKGEVDDKEVKLAERESSREKVDYMGEDRSQRKGPPLRRKTRARGS